MTDTAITKASPSVATVREGFTGTDIERTGEQGQTSLSAQATALVQARFIMAMRHPRDDDRVRQRLVKVCERPNFARRAFYSLPRGDKPGRLTGTMGRVEGLSVRFAEEAIRIAGNLERMSGVLYEDDYRRTVRVTVIDLETNASHGSDIIVSKTVERRTLKDGMVVLGERKNSLGDVVYVVQATDDDLFQKQNNLTAKAYRTLGLALIPADTREECEQVVVLTWRNEDAKDPDASRKRLLAEFAALGVPADQLKEYLGHDGTRMTPEERLSLGGLHAAIRDGEVTWVEALAERRAQRGATGDEKAALPSTVASKVQERAERIKKTQEAKRAAEAAAKTAPTNPSAPSSTAVGNDSVMDVGKDPAGLGPEPRKQREPGEEG